MTLCRYRISLIWVLSIVLQSTSMAAEPSRLAPSASELPGYKSLPSAGFDEVEYKLNHGDTIQVLVRGFPDLGCEAIVDTDGAVSVPYAGRFRAAGLPVSSLRSGIREAFSKRPILQRAADNRETYVTLTDEDVEVRIAAYRSIYILGDVGRPGELPYHPGTTVRQAISLGGGLDVMRYRLANPFMESADLKGENEVLWVEAARARLTLKSIEAELSGISEINASTLSDIPLDPALLGEMLRAETETLRRRLERHKQEINYRRRAIESDDGEVKLLRDQLSSEDGVQRSDSGELDQLAALRKNGSIPLIRYLDIRRINLENASRVQQTNRLLAQAGRELTQAHHNLKQYEENYQIRLQEELREKNTLYQSTLARLATNSEKLVHTSLLRSQLVRGKGAQVKIIVYRTLVDVRSRIEASEDTTLLPGDTIEVSLESPMGSGHAFGAEHSIDRSPRPPKEVSPKVISPIQN